MVAVRRSQIAVTLINIGVGKRSKVWQYFKQIIVDGVLKAEYLDNDCQMQLLTPNMSTTTLRRHLYYVHNLNEFKPIAKSSRKHKRSKISIHVKKQLDQLVIEAVVRDARCFTDFDKPGLKKLLEFAIPDKKMY